MTGVLDQLRIQVELEGYEPGTPQYEAVLRKRKVELCMEMKGFAGCDECPAYDSCQIVKEYLRDLHYGVKIDGPPGKRRSPDGSDSSASG